MVLGADSLDLAGIASELAARLSQSISAMELIEYSSLDALSRHLC